MVKESTRQLNSLQVVSIDLRNEMIRQVCDSLAKWTEVCVNAIWPSVSNFPCIAIRLNRMSVRPQADVTNHFDTVLSRLQMLISGITDTALEEELKQLLNQTKLACFEHCWTSERFTLQELAINELVYMGKSESSSCVPPVSTSKQPRFLPTVPAGGILRPA